jgi:hypothetical protein
LHCCFSFFSSAGVVAVPQLAECERILQQVGDAPDRRDLNERNRTLQAQREAAQAAEDFETVASLGEALKALQRESAYLPLSEEDYVTLPARHAELVQRVTDVCKDLAASAEYEKLQALAKKRDELKVPDVLSVLTTVASGARAGYADFFVTNVIAHYVCCYLVICRSQTSHCPPEGPVLSITGSKYGMSRRFSTIMAITSAP